MPRDIYILNDEKFAGVKNFATFEIKPLHVDIDTCEFDAVIFTSKNAVIALENRDKNWKNLEIYSIGEGTSGAIKELGAEVFYESKSAYGDEFAKEIAPKLKNQKVLFPRAKEVVSDVCGILKSLQVEVFEHIIYETICKDLSRVKEKPTFRDILIFTSPSSVRCFLKFCKLSSENIIVAIGKKTANAIPAGFKVNIPEKQTFASCVEFAKKLSKDFL